MKSAAAIRPEVLDPPVRAASPSVETAPRHGYRTDGRSLVLGLIATAAVYAVLLAIAFLTISYVALPRHAPPALTVVTLPDTASPEEKPEQKVTPDPVPQDRPIMPEPPQPPHISPVQRTPLPVMPVAPPAPAMVAQPVTPPPPATPKAAQPEAQPAPPPQPRSRGEDSWEGRVLATLIRYRVYPRHAQAYRQQGVPYIRFVMNRAGEVVSARLERSSGFPELDREALALPRRASPLPSPPDDKAGDTIELVVPVEFFLRR